MTSTQIAQIKDPELRALMEQADTRMDEGDNAACVHACADAYLKLLERQPAVLKGLRTVMGLPRVKAGLENGTLRFAPLMFPRLAAKLSVPEDGAPSITFARDQLGFGEAVQYYEFTLNLITDAEKGVVSMGEMAGE
jgi:hypothetical protein